MERVNHDAEPAVRMAFGVLRNERTIRQAARAEHLGFNTSSVFREFRRDKWTLFSVARDAGVDISELLEQEGDTCRKDRLPYEQILSASEIVVGRVRSLPAPQARVVEFRGLGWSWRRVRREMPGRVWFSLLEDYRAGMAELSSMEETNFLLYYT